MFEFTLFEISKIDTLRLIDMSACLFGALCIFFLWFSVKKEDKKLLDQDMGLVLIGFALLLWAAMDLYRVMGFMVAGQVSLVIKTFSAYNNALFLAALPFFLINKDKRISSFRPFANRTKWVISVLLANVIIVLFYSLSWGAESDRSIIILYFDVIYSVLTFICLGYAMFRSFKQRRAYQTTFIISTFLVTLMLIIPQLAFLPFFKIAHFDFISLISLISHFALILLLVVLAQSWVFEQDQEKIGNEKLQLQEEISELMFKNRDLLQSLNQNSAELERLNEKLTDFQYQISENKLSNQKEHSLKDLSDRELAVLKLIDKSYKEIGDQLFIARETVISHKKNIESKLGISGKDNLTEFAKINDLIESD